MTKSDLARRGVGVTAEGNHTVRLDQWLWAARFYKTRSLAAQAVDAGQAKLNAERVKPAHVVREGDAIAIRKQGTVWDVRVQALADRRGPATEAARLYAETAQSMATRADEAFQRKAAAVTQPHSAGRPTKRQRRKLEDFLSEP